MTFFAVWRWLNKKRNVLLERQCRKRCKEVLLTGNVLRDRTQDKVYAVIAHSSTSALLQDIHSGANLVVPFMRAGHLDTAGLTRWVLA